MNLRRWTTILFALLIAAITLVWQFPARGLLLLLPASALSSPMHRVHVIEGRLWRGAVSLSVTALPALQRVAWQCNVSPLSASVDCTLSGALQGAVTIQPFTGIAVARNLEFSSALDYRANTNLAVASDALYVRIESATVSRTRLELKANATAKDLVVASPALVPPRAALGEMFVECAPYTASGTTNCTAKNRASATRVDGNVTLAINRVRGAIEVASPGAAPLKLGF